jgi:hypothetical protein
VQKISQLNQSNTVIYLEVSDLLRRLNFGLPLDGITRVTLLALQSFKAQYGEQRVKLLIYDAVFSTFREMPTALIWKRFNALNNTNQKQFRHQTILSLSHSLGP